ncbi:MAG: hypothetical protein WA208_05090 [Thermoanaerobaculia bacterium]
MRLIVGTFVLLIAGCTTTAARPGDQLWNALAPLCGRAFEGRMVEGTAPSDAAFGSKRLVMHVRSCGRDEIRIPFHVGDDRSRTWVLTRQPSGVRLKHDHRHADGTPDAVTQYGGDTRTPDGRRLDFFADAETGAMLPAAATNIWTIALDERTFSYGLRREAEGRRFRVEFDLTKPVATPPDPW